MARAVSYGLGQYRFTKNYNYLTLLNNFEQKNTNGYQADLSYYKNTNTGSTYQDIYVTLPTQNNTSLVQYGKTYYIELTVPQNQEFTTTIDLKLCAGDGQVLNPNRFQSIKRIIVPPTPKEDDIYSPTLLFDYSSIEGSADSSEEELRLAFVEKYPSSGSSVIPGYAYYRETFEGKEYYYATTEEINGLKRIEKRSFMNFPQSWKMTSENTPTVTFKFAFSPKFNLENGYPYLLIETNRENVWSQTIQWVAEDTDTYYGTSLDIKEVVFKLYSVSDLLEGANNGTSQIVAGTNQLTHIGIWGHPEQMFTINGEEIKIGQTGFYELDDFIITSLGVVVTDKDKDRFTIDYEYKMIN